MKKIAIYFAIFAIFTLSIETSSANCSDFRQRFGPDSVVYNEPLYFNSKKQTSRDNRPKRSVREQIRTRMNESKK